MIVVWGGERRCISHWKPEKGLPRPEWAARVLPRAISRNVRLEKQIAEDCAAPRVCEVVAQSGK
jgi:hypothetical protein